MAETPAPKRQEARQHIADQRRRAGKPKALLEAQRLALADILSGICVECGAPYPVSRARVRMRRYCDACRERRTAS